MGFGINRGDNDVNVTVAETRATRSDFVLTVRIEDEEGGTFYGTFGARRCSFELSVKNGTFSMTDTQAEDGISVLHGMMDNRSNMPLAPKAVAALPAVVELLEQFPYSGLFNSGRRVLLMEAALSKTEAALAATV